MLADVMVPWAGWLAQPAMVRAMANELTAKENTAFDTRKPFDGARTRNTNERRTAAPRKAAGQPSAITQESGCVLGGRNRARGSGPGGARKARPKPRLGSAAKDTTLNPCVLAANARML